MKRVSVPSPSRSRRWKRWSADDAHQALEGWRSSGQTLAEYARAASVSPERLRRWSVKLGASTELFAPVSGELVPLVVRPTPSFGPVVIRLPGDVTLELADASSAPAAWVVEVARGLARTPR